MNQNQLIKKDDNQILETTNDVDKELKELFNNNKMIKGFGLLFKDLNKQIINNNNIILNEIRSMNTNKSNSLIKNKSINNS